MGGRDRRALQTTLSSLFVLAALFERPAAAQSESEAADVPVVVRGADGVMADTLRDAVRLASRWLGETGCQQIFSDFADARGHRLVERLQASGLTGSAYLHWLVFWNGSHERVCIWGDAFATTKPGSRVVYLCPAFRSLQLDLVEAAAIVIHEELHSLGLGENPPSSLEITARVLARCGPGRFSSIPARAS